MPPLEAGSSPAAEEQPDRLDLETTDPAASGRAAESNGRPSNAAPQAPPRIERIAERAYQLYEARGGAEGRSLDDWLTAEREIDEAEPER